MEEDFSIGLAFLMLVGAGFIIACFGAGVALMVLVLILIAGLISFGLISASIIVGLYQKSFTKEPVQWCNILAIK